MRGGNSIAITVCGPEPDCVAPGDLTLPGDISQGVQRAVSEMPEICLGWVGNTQTKDTQTQTNNNKGRQRAFCVEETLRV